MADTKRGAKDKANGKAKVTAKDTSKSKDDQGQIGEAIELVKTYVRQETVGPLQGIGKKIAKGMAGASLVGVGVFFLAIGLLRLIQSKIPRLSTGLLSWLSYLIVAIVCLAAVAVALSRVKKLEKELN